jgi:hypothetical protein
MSSPPPAAATAMVVAASALVKRDTDSLPLVVRRRLPTSHGCQPQRVHFFFGCRYHRGMRRKAAGLVVTDPIGHTPAMAVIRPAQRRRSPDRKRPGAGRKQASKTAPGTVTWNPPQSAAPGRPAAARPPGPGPRPGQGSGKVPAGFRPPAVPSVTAPGTAQPARPRAAAVCADQPGLQSSKGR